MSGTLTIGGMSAGLPSGYKVIGPVTTSGNMAIGQITDASLTSGDNTFSVPSGATSVAIFLGTEPSATVKVRTNLNIGDAGLPVAPLAEAISWMKFDLVTGVTNVILNSSASLTPVELTFI